LSPPVLTPVAPRAGDGRRGDDLRTGDVEVAGKGVGEDVDAGAAVRDIEGD
jgi:hypothetical protein